MAIIKIGNKVYNKGKFFTLKRDSVLQTPLLSGFSAPQSSAIDRESGRIFVVNTGVDSLTILDYNDPTIVLADLQIEALSNPYGIAIDRDKNRIFIANATGQKVTIHDYTNPSNTLGDFGAVGCFSVDIDKIGNRIFLGETQEIYIYNYETLDLIQTISGMNYPRQVVFDPNNNRIIQAHQGVNRIQIRQYDDPTVVLSEFNPGSAPFGCVWDKVYNEIYVSLAGGNAIKIYDYQTLTLKRTITQTEGQFDSPRFLSIDNYLNRIFIPNSGNSTISVLK